MMLGMIVSVRRGIGFVLLVFFITSAQAQERHRYQGEIDEANSRKLTYLPQFIADTEKVCESSSASEKCWRDLETHVQEVFVCPRSQKRFLEAVEHDHWTLENVIPHGPYLEVPTQVFNLFQRLAAVLPAQSDLLFPIEFNLQIYQGEWRNAHSLVDGTIVLSSALMTGEEAFTLGELAAVIAHELSHALAYDSMTLGCLALEWIATDRSMHQAQKDFIEDFRNSEREQIWQGISQNLEFSADAGATRILFSAGLDPMLMAQALKKLAPKTPSTGFSTGSHPEFDVRIAAATKAAQAVSAINMN